MEWTVKRDLMMGTVYVTLRNAGYAGFSVTVKRENGEVVEQRFFNYPKEAKKFALEGYGAYFN